MLVIRKAQLDVLGDAARRSALEVVQQHVRRYFADLMEDFTDEELYTLLSRISLECEQRGILGMRSLILFTNLSLVYGRGFLDRPEQAWMKEMLLDGKAGQPAEQLRKIYEKAMSPPKP